MKKLHRRPKQKPKHVLVRIKNDLQLSQDEIHEWLGISLDTFKNIVHGKVDSWEKHAAKISRITGIAVKSLLENQKSLMAIDGKIWTAQKYAPGIAWRNARELVRERSRGRHTLQWFRILMIKVARCMLAAYRDKKSGDAFVKMLRAIGETGKAFPSYTAKIPPNPSDAFMTVGGKTFQREKCPSEDWDTMLQVAVAAIDSTSPNGMEIIFDRFKKDILEEEGRQGEKLRFELRDAEKKARAIQEASKAKPAKPTRR
jgi:hypothetical protein